MSVEIYLDYGGDLQFDETGDLVLAKDGFAQADAHLAYALSTSLATTQRLTRMMFTRPRTLIPATRLWTAPDDIFNADKGVGIQTFVHQNITDSILATLQARILPEVMADPGVAPIPPPTLSLSTSGNMLYVSLNYTNLAGQTQTVGPTLIPTS